MPKKRIGLMGTFGYGNLGDAAIQDAMIQNLHAYYPDCDIYGFSINPEDTELRHHIRSFPITRMSWKDPISSEGIYGKLIDFFRSQNKPFYKNLARVLSRLPVECKLIADANRHIKDLDLLIISGGGQLDDLWAGGGPWSHPYTLFKFGVLSKLHQVRFLFVSVGAGPINAALSKLFIRLALQLAEYCSFRDEASKSLARAIGYQKNSLVFPDPAYSFRSLPHPQEEHNHPHSRPILGLGMVGYYRPGCWPIHDERIYADYLAKITQFCYSIVRRRYRLIFLPGETFYDQLAFADLREKLDEAGITAAKGDIVDCAIGSVSELLSAIQMTEIVVSSRFHGILLSHLLEKPVLAISYHQKIDSLMEDTGQGDFLVPIGSFDPADLLQRVTRLAAHKQEIAAKLRTINQANHSLLDEQYRQIYH